MTLTFILSFLNLSFQSLSKTKKNNNLISGQKNSSIIQLFCQSDKNKSLPLHIAIENSHLHIVKFIVELSEKEGNFEELKK